MQYKVHLLNLEKEGMVHLGDAINDGPRQGWHTIGQNGCIAPLQQCVFLPFNLFLASQDALEVMGVSQ